MTETGATIIDVLRSDHEAIERLLDDPAVADATEPGLAARAQLVMELVRHFVAEEQYLFPALREHVPDGDALAAAEFARDRHCEKQLRLLEDADISAERLRATVAEIRAAITRHIAEQDGIFASLAAACSPAQLAELGAGVLGAEQLAPTRPRPVASPSPAINKFTSFFEGFLDHARDYYAHRGVAPGRDGQ